MSNQKFQSLNAQEKITRSSSYHFSDPADSGSSKNF